MTFGAISTILPYIISGVRIAERFVIGRKRGADKKELATAFVIEEVTALIAGAKEMDGDPSSFNHLEIIMKTEGIKGKIDGLVDSIVALMNYSEGFSKPLEKPPVKLN